MLIVATRVGRYLRDDTHVGILVGYINQVGHTQVVFQVVAYLGYSSTSRKLLEA